MSHFSFWSRFTAGTAGAACLLLASVGVANDASAQESAAPPAAASPARLRVFGQNGITVDFYENSTCFGGDAKKTRVSGGMGDAFSSFMGSAKNTSIGMTETPTTKNLGKRDGVLSKAYFREYEVGAEQPVSLYMYFRTTPTGFAYVCHHVGGTFKAEAGKEYEVGFQLQGKECLAVVQQIEKNEQGEASLKDVPVLPAPECK